MTKVTIEAAPWIIATAAALLETFSDRAPTSDRVGLGHIAEQLKAASVKARDDLDAA